MAFIAVTFSFQFQKTQQWWLNRNSLAPQQGNWGTAAQQGLLKTRVVCGSV